MSSDTTTTKIAEFAACARFEDLPDSVVDAARTRIVDTIGCAFGGYESPTMAAAGVTAPAVAPGPGGGYPIVGWQLGRPGPDVAVDMAAFLNTTMIRYLDFNDWYPGGHPSDTIGGLVAFAAAHGVTGRRLLAATVVSYEVFSRITHHSKFRKLGYDQGFAMGVATTAALGTLLGLNAETIAAAVGIIAATGVPTRATRSGQLSMWKGCATAFATRNAAFVTMLAQAGMTGPPAPFEGRNGIHDLITGPFSVGDFDDIPAADYGILGTSLKYWPVCYHCQAAAWAGLRLRDLLDPADVALVEVGTYWEAWRDTGSEPDKWDPLSRETADHSLPYVLARAFAYGPIDAFAFEPDAYRDQSLRPLMDRVRVEVDDQVQAAFPDLPMLRLRAVGHDGSATEFEIAGPAGHATNPLTRDQVRDKFGSLVSPVLGDRALPLFDAWWECVTSESPLPMAESAFLRDGVGV